MKIYRSLQKTFCSWSNGRKPLYLLLTVSLLLKVVMVACNDVVNDDGVLYITAAQKLASGDFGGSIEVYRMPFYPLLIAGFHLLIPDWVIAGQAISVLALGTAVVPLWLITRALFGSTAALWGGVAYVVSPWFNELAADVVRGPVFFFCSLWAVYFAWLALSTARFWCYLATSAWMTLALLARIEGAVLPFAFLSVLLVLMCADRGSRFAWLRGMLAFFALPALMVVTALALAGPDVLGYVRLNEIIGRFSGVFNLHILDSYRRIYGQLQELEKSLPGWSMGQSFSEISRHNLWLIYLIGLFQVTFKVVFPTQVLPVLVGFASIRTWNRGHLLLFTFLGGCLTACYLYHVQRNFIDTRYLALPALLLFPWAGAGTAFLLDWAKRFRCSRAIIFLLVVVLLLLPLGRTVKGYVGQDRVVKMAGQWLAQQQGVEEFRLVCNDGRIPFYAGLGRDYYSSDIERIGRVSARRNADLIVVETAKKGRSAVPPFGGYELWKEFEDRKNVVLILRKVT